MIRKFRIVLHIGTEKTATTYLQSLLNDNFARLFMQGVFYYTSTDRIEARSLSAAALDDESDDDYLAGLGVTECESRKQYRDAVAEQLSLVLRSLPGNIHTVVISSEHFHSRLRKADQLEWLKSLLRPYASKINILVYLRRQVDMLESYYSTELKGVGCRSINELISDRFIPTNSYYNHWEMLELWSGVFGENSVIPRVFDSSHFFGGNISSDFMHAANLPNVDALRLGSYVRINESVLPFGQMLLRVINTVLRDESLSNNTRQLLLSLKANVIKYFSGSVRQLSFACAFQAQSVFDDCNFAVRDKWFPDLTMLFNPVDEKDFGGFKFHQFDIKQADLVVELFDILSGRYYDALRPLDDMAESLFELAISYENDELDIAMQLLDVVMRLRPDNIVYAEQFNVYHDRSQTIMHKIKTAHRTALAYSLRKHRK